jgi:hypothetical protein
MFLSVVALILCSACLKAQDESIIMLLVKQKQYDKAKDEVDKWLAKPKLKDNDKTTALLWKMLVNSEIYTDSAFGPKYPDANVQALDAFHEYQELDPELKSMKEGHFEGAVGNLYSGSFNRGRDFFQNKKWDSSFAYFSEAERLGTFLLDNKMSASDSKMDTVTILYTGYAAQNAKMYDSAAKYYSKLTDVKIAGPDYEDIYKFMIEHYSEQKDEANFKNYLALAKELYPNDSPTWTQYEMSNMTANASISDLYQNYLRDAAAGGMNEDKLIGYAEALATNDQSQLEGIDSTTKVNIKLASAEAFAKAFDLTNTGLYAFNVGVIYYSIYSDLDDRYASNRGESAALKATRAEIAKEEMAYSDTASQWLEKAFPLLKDKQDRTRSETASLNRLVDYLANIYYWQREQTKSNGNSQDYDKLDGLYKKYDALHATFK